MLGRASPMSVLVSTELLDEAGTEEVAALAVVLARPVHVPAPREEDDADDVILDRADDDPGEQHVLARQRDEFTCGRCFLVAHVSRRAAPDLCRDCA